MKKISRVIVPLALMALPSLAAAQSAGGINLSLVQRYAASVINLINGVFVPVLFALAFLMFIWGVYKYFILGATEESAKGEGRQFVLWGVIGFVVILSVWGIVNIFIGTLGLTSNNVPAFPTLGGSPTAGTSSSGSALSNCLSTCSGTCSQDNLTGTVTCTPK
ncbi:MAG TPA: pilin [Candidatus Paceibacterota bacterium]|nr:pilin [Candidatus Paceibacterota bacterium]